MKNIMFRFIFGFMSICLPISAMSAIISFDFTGRVTVMNPIGEIVVGGGASSSDPYGLQAPIHSTFTYDTTAGSGLGELIISPLTYYGQDTRFYNISLQRVEGTNYVLGNMLVDYGLSIGLPLSLVWDASGLLNAIDYGLQAGDVVSGTNLIRNGNTIFDVNSAIPASDGYDYNGYIVNQGAAPLATTSLNTTDLCTGGGECIGVAISGTTPFYDDGIAGSPQIDGPFPGMQVSIDIGSGNSLTVLSVNAVPVPTAVWLFASGLLGLVSFFRRTKQ